jgi:hypothetical protein
VPVPPAVPSIKIFTKPLNPRNENPRLGKKLADTFTKTSRTESSHDNPTIRNSEVDGNKVSGNQVNPRDAQNKLALSRKVWIPNYLVGSIPNL